MTPRFFTLREPSLWPDSGQERALPPKAREVAELAKQMRNLDPSRFPGNPALIDEMHREVLGSIDRLELELQRSGASAEARSGKSNVVPTGYEESVAEYYRRLSKNP